MSARKLTAGDLQAVTKYSRDQLRGLLDQLDLALKIPVLIPGMTRVFSVHEFLLVVLCCEIESTFGMKRKTVVSFAPEMAKTLARPRPLAQDPKLVLSFGTMQVSYLDGFETIHAGLVVPLAAILKKVDNYLLPNREDQSQYQGALNLGPGLMSEQLLESQSLKMASGQD